MRAVTKVRWSAAIAASIMMLLGAPGELFAQEIYLDCKGPPHANWRLTIDYARKSVELANELGRYGPFLAQVSNDSISWEGDDGYYALNRANLRLTARAKRRVGFLEFDCQRTAKPRPKI